MMGQLSLEFYRHAASAEGSVHSNEIDGAEGQRLMAESMHEILKTLEVKRRTLRKVLPRMNEGAINEAVEDDVV
jgi:hypothetical protein